MRYRSMSVLLSAAVLAVTNLNHVAAIVIAPGQDNQTKFGRTRDHHCCCRMQIHGDLGLVGPAFRGCSGAYQFGLIM